MSIKTMEFFNVLISLINLPAPAIATAAATATAGLFFLFVPKDVEHNHVMLFLQGLLVGRFLPRKETLQKSHHDNSSSLRSGS